MAVSISMGVIAADNIATGVTQIKQDKPMLTYGAQVIKWTGLAPEGYEEMIYGFVDLSLSSKAYMISKSVPSTVKIVMMAKSTDAPNILKNARIVIDNFMPNSMKNRHRIGYKTVDETKLTQVESLSNTSQSGTITKVEGVVSDVGEAVRGTSGQIVRNNDGLHEVKINSTPLEGQGRLNTPDLGGSGKLKPAEAASAAQLESSLGKMERYTSSTGATLGTSPDFVPVDFRVLTPANQKIFMDYIKTQPKAQQDQIIIMR